MYGDNEEGNTPGHREDSSSTLSTFADMLHGSIGVPESTSYDDTDSSPDTTFDSGSTP